jgi:lipopolysaccharide export system protein LptA
MSRKAVYTSQDGKIVLTGKPQIMQGQNTYTGDKITIFKDQDRVIFEPRARLVMYSDEEAGPLQELP